MKKAIATLLVLGALLVIAGAYAQEQAPQITPEQALTVLSQAADQYRGTKQEHMLIQQAQSILGDALKELDALKNPKPAETPKVEEAPK